MKKLLDIVVIVVVCILSFSSCTKDENEESILTSLSDTSWSMHDCGTDLYISFTESAYALVISEQGYSIIILGDYVYNNPNFNTSNSTYPSTTIKGYVSQDGNILYLTLNGDRASLTRDN